MRLSIVFSTTLSGVSTVTGVSLSIVQTTTSRLKTIDSITKKLRQSLVETGRTVKKERNVWDNDYYTSGDSSSNADSSSNSLVQTESSSQAMTAMKESKMKMVIDLMENLKSEVETHIQNSEVVWSKAEAEYEQNMKRLDKELATTHGNIVKLDGLLEKTFNEGEQAGKLLGELGTELGILEGTLAEKTKIRNEESTAFKKVEKELEESIESVFSAKEVLKSKMQLKDEEAEIKAEEAKEEAQKEETMLAQEQKEEESEKKAIFLAKQESAKEARDMGEVVSFLQTKRSQQSLKSELKSAMALAQKVKAPGDAANRVLDLLDDLSDKFTEERNAKQKADKKRQTAFLKLKTNLLSRIENVKQQQGEQQEIKGAKEAKSAEVASSLKELKKALKEAEMEHSEMKTEYSLKSDEYKNEQTVRREEIEALMRAIEILKGGVSENAGKNNAGGVVSEGAIINGDSGPEGSVPPAEQDGNTAEDSVEDASFIVEEAEQGTTTTFVQTREQTNQKYINDLSTMNNKITGNKKIKLMQILLSEGKKEDRILALVAARVDADDPLGKVKDMIEMLIKRLQREQVEQEKKDGWCKKQIAANKSDLADTKEKLQVLDTRKENTDGEVQQNKSSMKKLNKRISEIEVVTKDSTKNRGEEREMNENQIAEDKQAVGAVANAIQVLQDFFGTSSSEETDQTTGTTEFFLQTNERMSESSTASTESKSKSDAGNNIIEILSLMEDEFSRSLAETTQVEAQAKKAFDKEMKELALEKAVMVEEIKSSQKAIIRLEMSLREIEQDLVAENENFTIAGEEKKNLEEQCVHKETPYAEKLKLREQEMQSLREALEVLKAQ